MEKRNSNRYETEQSIVCAFFTSHSTHDTFDGKMKNYGNCGLYAELQTRFKEGTVLLVRTVDGTPGRLYAKIEEGFRSISIAEVRWSKHIHADGTECYGTGLKHLSV